MGEGFEEKMVSKQFSSVVKASCLNMAQALGKIIFLDLALSQKFKVAGGLKRSKHCLGTLVLDSMGPVIKQKQN